MELNKTPVKVGLLGLGTVGSGVYKILSRFSNVQIVKIAVRDINKARVDIPSDLLTESVEEVISQPDVDIVVEVMGGKEYPYQTIREALKSKKHVVTANKVVISNYGAELFQLAAQNGQNLLFEAAVAGGIPIILPLKTSLAGNRIRQIAAILNGTTNYILTRMEQAGLGFREALKEAQDKGFAESDPSADIEGDDAACKIGILASIAYQRELDQKDIYKEGISNIDLADIDMARTLGYAIRLIALAKSLEKFPSAASAVSLRCSNPHLLRVNSGSALLAPCSCSPHETSQTPSNGSIDIRVHPMLVPLEHPLAKITYENNAIWIEGDAVGDVMFYGKGAGELPTASAVVGDIMLIANALQNGQTSLAGIRVNLRGKGNVYNILETTNAYYIRLETEDKPGVIGQLGKACGDHEVSLNAIMQKGTNPNNSSATIVLLTHKVREANLQAALQEIRDQSTTISVRSVLRVFQP